MERPAAGMIPSYGNNSDILRSPFRRPSESLSPQRIGRDQWTGFDIYLGGAWKCRTRPRRVELQAVRVEQTLPRQAAAKLPCPNAPRQRIGEAGANAAVQEPPLGYRQQDVSELINARARRQQRYDISNGLLDRKIRCRIEKQPGKNGLIRVRPRAAQPIRRLGPKRDCYGCRRRRDAGPKRRC